MPTMEPRDLSDDLKLLRSAVSHARDGALLTAPGDDDPMGAAIAFANASFLQLAGYSADEVLDRSVRLLFGPRTSRAGLRALQAALSKREHAVVELVGYARGGNEFVAEVAVAPLDDGRGFLWWWRDLTAQRREAAAAREGDEQLRLAFDEGPLGMALLDADERFETVNRRLCALLGRAESEVIGRSLDEVTHPEDRDLHARGAMAMRRGDAASYTVERRALLPDGSVQWLRMTATPLRGEPDEDRTLTMFERTTGQREDRQALADATDRAEAAARARGVFLSSVTHELRTPLNAVLGFAQVLLKETAGPLNERQRAYTRHILDSGQHMLRLVNDLLDLRRVEEGRQSVTLAPIALGTYVDRAVTMLRSECVARRLDIAVELPAELPKVRADGDAVVQVLANLLTNAVGFTRDDGSGRIVVRARDEGPRVRVEVEDNGAGIAAEDHERIFEWFEQGRQPASGERKGTGIGLALTRALVRRMGGEVSLSSALGAGSTFSFTLLSVEEPS